MGPRSLIFLSSLALACVAGRADWTYTGELGVTGAGAVYALAVSGNTLFAGTADDGVHRSTQGTYTWTRISEFRNSPTVYGLLVDGAYLFAATHGGLYRCPVSDTTWIMMDPDSSGSRFTSIAMLGGTLFAGSGSGYGVFHSTDHGNTWTGSRSGLGTFPVIYSLGALGPYLYAGSQDAGYRSADTGRTWSRMEGLPARPLQDFLAQDGKLFCATEGEGVFRSLDSGATWKRANTGLPDKAEVFDLLLSGGEMYAAAYSKGIYRSTDAGNSWTQVRTGEDPRECYSLAVAGSYLFAGAYGSVWQRPLAEMTSIRLRNPTGNQGSGPGPGPILLAGTGIAFAKAEPRSVAIGLYDLRGKRLDVLLER